VTTGHRTVHTTAARETSAIVRREGRRRSARSTAAGRNGRILAVHGRSTGAIVHQVAARGTMVHEAAAIARRGDHPEGARSMTAAPIEVGRAVHDHSTAGSARTVAVRGTSNHGTSASGRGTRARTVVVRRAGLLRAVRSIGTAGLTDRPRAARDPSTPGIVHRHAGRATIARGTIARARIVVVHTVDLPIAVRSMTAAGLTDQAPATRGRSTRGIVSRRVGRGTIARGTARETSARGMSGRATPANGRRDPGPAGGAPSTAGNQPGERGRAVTDRTRVGSILAGAADRRARASPVPRGEIASDRGLARHVRAMGRGHGSARATLVVVTGTSGLVAKALPRLDARIAGEPHGRSARGQRLRASGAGTRRRGRKALRLDPIALPAPVRSRCLSPVAARTS
jgi:hypothetical protein